MKGGGSEKGPPFFYQLVSIITKLVAHYGGRSEKTLFPQGAMSTQRLFAAFLFMHSGHVDVYFVAAIPCFPAAYHAEYPAVPCPAQVFESIGLLKVLI